MLRYELCFSTTREMHVFENLNIEQELSHSLVCGCICYSIQDVHRVWLTLFLWSHFFVFWSH